MGGAAGTVYVHCQHGVSRSSTIVIAYIMWRQRLTYDEALDLVRTARPTVNPNIGFACALLQWGSALAEPPAALQVWGALTVTSPVSEYGAGGGDTGEAGGAAGGAVGGPTMRSVLLPPSLLPAMRGAAAEEAASPPPPLHSPPSHQAHCREEVRFELRRHGAVVLQHGENAALWLAGGGGDDANEALLAAAQRLLHRLVTYHHLPEESAEIAIKFAELDGRESDAFWQLLLPPAPTPAPSVPDLPAAFRDVSMDDGPGGGGGSGGMPPPPMTASRAAMGQKRGFGAAAGVDSAHTPAGGASAAASASALGPPPAVPPLAPPRAPFVVPSIVTPGSTDRSMHSQPSDRGLGGGGGGGGSATPHHNHATQQHQRTPSELNEAMVLAVLQTVASELLLLVQREFDLLHSVPMEAADAAGEGGDGAAGGGSGGGADGGGDGGDGAVLHPSALLSECQELLLARPASADEEHAALSQLSGLLGDLAPHLGSAGSGTLAALGESLVGFLEALPASRGEELLRAEEVMLRAIARASAIEDDEQQQ